MTIRIHPTAEVSPQANLGDGTSVWHQAQVRESAAIGSNCIIGKGVYIDAGVSIGNNVKIQNYVSVYQGVYIEDGVFVGPHVCFTNDLRPRAITPDNNLKSANEWLLINTRIRHGAAIGANSTIRCGITIGEWSMVGAGSVVTKNIPDYGLAWGNPAILHGFVCSCGSNLEKHAKSDNYIQAKCSGCNQSVTIPVNIWEDQR